MMPPPSTPSPKQSASSRARVELPGSPGINVTVTYIPEYGKVAAMTGYGRNDGGIEKARSMIESHQYVLDSDWSESQPTPAEENEKIDRDA